LIQNRQYEEDKPVNNIEVPCSIFNTKIQDTHFASTEGCRVLQECGQLVHHIFDLLATHAF
jgi:hypothetical protein